MDTTSSLLKAKVKSAVEPHVQRDHDHFQARLSQASTQLQNATVTVNGQKNLLAASQQVHASTEKVDTVDAHRGAV